MICQHCRQPIGKSVTRGALTVTTQPFAAFWGGQLLHGLDPMQCRILALLIERESVPFAAFIIECLGPNTIDRTIRVHISKLRSKLPRACTIDNVHGWGYKLVIDKEVA